MAPVLVKAILLLTAMFEIPEANFNLNKCPNTRIAVFLFPPVMVTGSLTAIPKIISPSEPVNFLTVGFVVSEDTLGCFGAKVGSGFCGQFFIVDRKSTRLNSSHSV